MICNDSNNTNNRALRTKQITLNDAKDHSTKCRYTFTQCRVYEKDRIQTKFMCVAASVNSSIAQFYVIGINGLLLFQFGIYTNVTILERVFFLVFILFLFSG